jgi:hypothetical protein
MGQHGVAQRSRRGRPCAGGQRSNSAAIRSHIMGKGAVGHRQRTETAGTFVGDAAAISVAGRGIAAEGAIGERQRMSASELRFINRAAVTYTR